MGIEPTTTGITILRFLAQDQWDAAFCFLPRVGQSARLSA